MNKSFMKELMSVGLIIISVLGGACLLALGLRHTLNPPPNPNYCVENSPKVATSGYIQPANSGVFTTTPQTHYLYYKGETKLTDEECKIRRCVTENEYERQMYGH